MLDGHFIVNAVAHAYDLSDANTQDNRYAQALREQLISLHRDWQGGYGLSAREQRTNWPIEVLARTLFLETDCDMAATHTLRLASHFFDRLLSPQKTVEHLERRPQ